MDAPKNAPKAETFDIPTAHVRKLKSVTRGTGAKTLRLSHEDGVTTFAGLDPDREGKDRTRVSGKISGYDEVKFGKAPVKREKKAAAQEDDSAE